MNYNIGIEGIQEGRIEGIQEGEFKVVLRLLNRRFGELPPNITGLPPYINTRKLTKPLLQVASKKKLKRGYWVHFSLENGCTVDCIWSRAIP
ncbi:DUF4351 domain-containing protein [Microcystis aeruginosa]|uniref:DUF4351 domain-containing protein n=1 Tax=Microcystis aeruginosa TaxID=1126 RepID=UPI0037C8B4F8